MAMAMMTFGEPDVLRPVLTPARPPRRGELVVRIRASSVNPIEWKMRQGLGLPHVVWKRLLGRPMILGLDFSGEVLEVGAGVRRFRVGDEVFGATRLCGTYSERLVVPETGAIARKPCAVSHGHAAVAPFAARVALACLETKQTDWSNLRVLVIGASGGVGHFAVQMARRVFGARTVAAICSRRNAAFVTRCGADEVFAYDETPPGELLVTHPHWAGHFDLIVDAVGLDPYYAASVPALLSAEGRYVAAALPARSVDAPGEATGPIGLPVLIARLAARRLTGRYRLVAGLIGGLPGLEGMQRIARWLEEGKLAPHIHATFPLASMAEAHRLSQSGRVVGKIAIHID